MIVICTMLIGIHFFPITTIVRFFYRYSHIIECWYLMFQSLINIYLEFMFLTCAANDGFICCFSLQKLSKWFTTNGGCSSASLVCIAWYIYSPFDWFYCIFEVRGTFFFFFFSLVMSWTSCNYWYAGPVDESKNQLPDILCVIQVCRYHHYVAH